MTDQTNGIALLRERLAALEQSARRLDHLEAGIERLAAGQREYGEARVEEARAARRFIATTVISSAAVLVGAGGLIFALLSSP